MVRRRGVPDEPFGLAALARGWNRACEAAAMALGSVHVGCSSGARLTGASAAPAQPLAWSAPVLVDQGVPQHAVASFGIRALSCPSVSLCVALDDLGNVLTTTNPGLISSWTVTRMRGGVVPQGVSCPSVSLCLAVGSSGDAGRVIESANPVGGARTWRVMRVGAATDPTAVSCPSVTLCVGVDLNGDVLSSTDPTGGTQAWHVVHVDSSGTRGDGGGLSSISCPSVSLCVALGAGDVLNSTNPTAGAGAWRRVKDIAFAPAPGDSVVSCPSVSLCVVASSGSILSSTNPTGGRSAWRSLQSLALQLVNRILLPVGIAVRCRGHLWRSGDLNKPDRWGERMVVCAHRRHQRIERDFVPLGQPVRRCRWLGQRLARSTVHARPCGAESLGRAAGQRRAAGGGSSGRPQRSLARRFWSRGCLPASRSGVRGTGQGCQLCRFGNLTRTGDPHRPRRPPP